MSGHDSAAEDCVMKSPGDKAKRALIQKVSQQKVDRFYTRARCLNSSEAQNLDAQLKFISRTENEFRKNHTASQTLFIIERRRNIERLTQKPIREEIGRLDERRRRSSALPRIEMLQAINSASNEVERRDTERLRKATSALPSSTVSALHKGIPTLLSKDKIEQRVKTAPPAARRHSLLLDNSAQQPDPLRYLQRVETSDAYSGIRNKIVQTDAGKHSEHSKYKRLYPTYLAISPVEHSRLCRSRKERLIERFKNFHAGSDRRCSALVQSWIQNFGANRVKEHGL